MLSRSQGHIIILVHSGPNVKYNFIQHCFCELGSHFEDIFESVSHIFFLGFASKDIIKLTLVPQNAGHKNSADLHNK
jgi:hypothetical protein